jgi:hypothetical protein
VAIKALGDELQPFPCPIVECRVSSYILLVLVMAVEVTAKGPPSRLVTNVGHGVGR